MSIEKFSPEKRENSVESFEKFFDTKQEAMDFVQSFWEGTGRDTMLSSPMGIDWSDILTMGDRTKVDEKQGQWRAWVSGNRAPLSEKGNQWLRDQGLI